MSLQFIFGNSGSGKSDYLYETILKQAKKEPDRNFLILVPEQFTMQTQRELVWRQENHAIMNVDVLSFARLAYRIFDELFCRELVILEETGKNLVLRKVAEQKKKELRVLGGNMNKMGYVGEVKSLISELTQYSITPEDLEGFLSDETLSEALRLKMGDILTMYRGFREYLEGRYITSEEVLTLLCEVADQSGILKDSVIVFDEFTGFTPIQNRLLGELLKLADRVMVSVTIDIREDFYHSKGIHELFSMSKKTVETLMKTAERLGVPVEEAKVLGTGRHRRYENAPELFFMEQNLFRPRPGKWSGPVKNISITGLLNPREELRFAAKEIAGLVRKMGYRYREIAVVTGDAAQYANYVPEIFEQYDIPYFIDQTKNILFHPLIEFIRAALEVVESDFSYQSIFRFLRSGLAGVREADIDGLENYVLAAGIRGLKRWNKPWTFVMRDGTKGDILRMNEIRAGICNIFYPLFEAFGRGGCGGKKEERNVKRQTAALYRFIRGLSVEEKLKEKELMFSENADQVRAFEYAQIYRIVMDLLDKVVSLLGDEQMSVREYGDILDAGFEAAKIGVIPPGNDKVIIGDIERTRLNHIRVLFFVGVNDGVVPKAGTAGGIISQFERELLSEHHLELAPGAREKVFIQKFYLYLNMTKPSDLLYVTFSRVNADGKALRRSYLIGMLQKLFPALSVLEKQEDEAGEELLTPESSMQFFLAGLRQDGFRQAGAGKEADSGKEGKKEADGGKEADSGEFCTDRDKLWAALAGWYLSKEGSREDTMRLIGAAYQRYSEEKISRAVTRALYGTVLENSVTRLERFAACAFAHYLDYGLGLKERQLFEFASVDMGNIYHDALEHFAKRVEESEYTWFTVPKDVEKIWIEESMTDAVEGCGNAGVFEDAGNRYLLMRMKETLKKTIWALTVQIRKGRFTPRAFEVSFSRADDLSAIRFKLGEEEEMQLRGRIDRLDVYETEDKVYVKIIDYKSGNTSFSLLNLYYGLQLQLVVYLNAAKELASKWYPGKTVEPAGIFYYHIDDPMVEGTGTESEEEIRRAVLEQLKVNGLVNEDPEIYRAMDTDFTGASAVIPVSLKTDGSLKAVSKTASTADFQTMSDYVGRVLKDAGKEILSGDTSIHPYQLDKRTGCDYCPYHMVCGFDTEIPGFSFRKLSKFSDTAEILAKMREDG